jgi:hypothetical protein
MMWGRGRKLVKREAKVSGVSKPPQLYVAKVSGSLRGLEEKFSELARMGGGVLGVVLLDGVGRMPGEWDVWASWVVIGRWAERTL